MDEESLRFWIIPIVCFVGAMIMFSITLEYKINTILPNAELERQEMQEMLCPEILQKDASNSYWTPQNSKIGREKAASCSVPQEGESSGLSPYVEFCTPGGFAPNKKIENSTHLFNHDACVWDLK